jgi:PAS domain S-box-containing protein
MMLMARRLARRFPSSVRWRLTWAIFMVSFAAMITARLLVFLMVYTEFPPWIPYLHRVGTPLIVSLTLFVGMWCLDHLFQDVLSLDKMISPAPAAHITITHNSIITSWDRGAEAMFGYSALQAIGQPLPELIMPEHLRAGHYAGIAQYAEGHMRVPRRKVYPVTALHQDGSEFPVLVEINIVPQPDGTLLFAGTVNRLVTR